MDANLRIVQEFRLEHRHRDGGWGAMEPEQHDSSSHDGERSWLRGTIFRCRSCDETVTLTTDGGGDEVHDAGATTRTTLAALCAEAADDVVEDRQAPPERVDADPLVDAVEALHEPLLGVQPER